ncbi:S8 family serine peptidase, partial [Dactylosporangium matsuzakiense]
MGVTLSMLLRRAVAVACVLGAAALNPLGSPASAAPPADHKLTPQHLPKPDRSRDPKALSFDPHSVLVQFKPGASAASTDRAVTSRNAKVAGAVAGTRFTRVTTAGAATDLARELGKDPSVASVSLNYRRQASTTPNDPGYTYGDQSYLNTVRMPLAWDRSTGSADQIIAVVDTGVDGQHPDLAGRVLAGYNAITRTAIAAGANSDDYGHGSMVAGIAAADTNNGIGVAGVDWNARILPVKVLDQDGNGYDADIAAGIVWAADHGAKVINLSLGGPGDTPILHDAVTYATNKGSLLVVAAGNSADSEPQYPAAYPEVLAVAATDANGKLTDFSTYGDWVDVAAPGFGIVSTSVPQNGYEYFIGDGTSFAAPIVSGVAALMRSNNPALTPAQLLATIKGTARDAGPRGFDKYFGNGVLDAYAALGGGWAPEFPQASLGAGEPNDVPARATAFTAPVTGTIGIEGDVDWYRFDSIAVRSATVKVTAAAYDFNRGQNINATVEVYDKDLRLLGQNNDPASGSAAVDLTLDAGTYYIAVHDLSGDADDRPYTLAVTDGPATQQQFQPYQSIATGSWAKAVAVGDVTGDGRNDVVLATSSYFDETNDYKLFVFAQKADGTLAAPVKYAMQSPTSRPVIALLDANGDGRKDVALTTGAGVQIFRQTSAGALTDTGVLAGTEGAGSITAADMDADGDLDLVVDDTAGIQLLTQGSAGAFTASSVSADRSPEVEVGDVDGDGRADVVGFQSFAVNVYHHTTSGWTRTDHSTTNYPWSIGGIEVADVTSDGKADVVATIEANSPNSVVNVFKQNATGGLDAPAVYSTIDLADSVEAADVTGDGRTDLVVAHGGYSAVSVLPQTTGGTLGTPITAFAPISNYIDPGGLAVGDINSDGRIDVVVADFNSGLILMRNGGGSTPGGEQAWVKSTGIADFATGVALDAKPTITFTRSVDASKIRLVHGVTGQTVPASVSFSGDTATITPSAALQDNTPYRVVVDGILSSTFRTVDTAPAAVTNLQAVGSTAVVSWTAP